MTNRRVGIIDFFKFIFSILLVGFHTGTFYDTGEEFIWRGGFIAVEFFFIVSGYLLTSRAATEKCENPFEANLKMLERKILHFFPYVFLACMTANIFFELSNKSDLYDIGNHLLLSVFDIFGLQMAGFVGFYATGVSWYLSSLLIVSFMFYPVLCKKRCLFTYWIAPLLAILLYGYIGKQGSGLSFPDQWYGIIYEGLLRGIADMSVGCMAYELKCHLDSASIKSRNALLPLEMSGYMAVLCYGMFHDAYTDLHDFLIIPLIFFSVAISFSNKSVLYKFFARRQFTGGQLGALSLSIFLNHVYVKDSLPRLFPGMDRRTMLLCYVLITFALSLANCFAGKQLAKIVNSLSRVLALVLGMVSFSLCAMLLSDL